jgi:hypothetical protein
MITFLLIEVNGVIKQTKAQETSFDFLYKKCGFRSENNFAKRTTWKDNINGEKYIIELWAKDNGKANNENKYDFPPPVDKELYFGTCLLIRKNEDGNIINLESSLWMKIYEKLFGGFENIGDEDEEYSEDELENIDKKLKTKHGYLKDGFIVDFAAVSDEDNGGNEDNDNEDNEDDEDDDDDEEHDDEDNDDDDEDACSRDNDSNELEESDYEYSDDD